MDTRTNSSNKKGWPKTELILSSRHVAVFTSSCKNVVADNFSYYADVQGTSSAVPRGLSVGVGIGIGVGGGCGS